MLKTDVTPPTLVVAGAWNPDILTPQWVASNAMGIKLEQNFSVNVELPIGDPTQRPIFEFHDIRYRSMKNALTFFLNKEDKVAESISVVANILALLSHTPVTAFGFNFQYEVEDPSSKLLNTFSSSNEIASFVDDENAETVKREWKASVKTNDNLLNVHALLEAVKVSINFNVHFEVTSAKEASDKLKVHDIYNKIKTKVNTVATKLSTLGEE